MVIFFIENGVLLLCSLEETCQIDDVNVALSEHCNHSHSLTADIISPEWRVSLQYRFLIGYRNYYKLNASSAESIGDVPELVEIY